MAVVGGRALHREMAREGNEDGGSEAETRACPLAVPRWGGCRGPRKDAPTEEVGLLNGGQAAPNGKRDNKTCHSRCTALAAGTAMKGTHATGLAGSSRQLVRGWQCRRDREEPALD